MCEKTSRTHLDRLGNKYTNCEVITHKPGFWQSTGLRGRSQWPRCLKGPHTHKGELWSLTVLKNCTKNWTEYVWDSLSKLRSSLYKRRLERTFLRPALLPVQTAQFTQFFRQVWRHTVKSVSLTESV